MEFILQNLMMVAVAVLSGTALLVMSFRRPGGGRNGVTSSQATLLINRENAQVVDVREPAEYVDGHLPESRNIPLARLEERAGELSEFKETPLILVCQNGVRSAGACKQLQKLGFGKVSNLEGGISGWRTAGLPLKKGAKK